MGLLQLAGAVSGFGQGVQQGLQQTQQTMSYMQLEQLRQEMERERMRETWGHEEGLINKKHAWDVEAADTAHSRELARDEQRQDAEASQRRMDRQNDREKMDKQIAANTDLENLRSKNNMTEEERKAKTRMQEERFKAAEQAKLEQVRSGTTLTGKMIENQRPVGGRAGSEGTEKWSDEQKARFKLLNDRIKPYEDKMTMGMKLTPAEQKIYDDSTRELNALTGGQEPPPKNAVDISKFDKFKGASPY